MDVYKTLNVCHLLVFIALWSLYTTTGFAFTLAIMIINILKYLTEGKKSTALQIFIVPLFYFPLLAIMCLVLIMKLRAHRKKLEDDRRMSNPVERAKIAYENWKIGNATGYPQSRIYPKYIVLILFR